jgi:hypothetical protein
MHVWWCEIVANDDIPMDETLVRCIVKKSRHVTKNIFVVIYNTLLRIKNPIVWLLLSVTVGLGISTVLHEIIKYADVIGTYIVENIYIPLHTFCAWIVTSVSNGIYGFFEVWLSVPFIISIPVTIISLAVASIVVYSTMWCLNRRYANEDLVHHGDGENETRFVIVSGALGLIFSFFAVDLKNAFSPLYIIVAVGVCIVLGGIAGDYLDMRRYYFARIARERTEQQRSADPVENDDVQEHE